MKQQIIDYIDNPEQLEQMYRADKEGFKSAFNAQYAQLKGQYSADFWNARLNFSGQAAKRTAPEELIFIVIASLLAGLTAKLPVLLSIDESFYYMRNFSFIIFPFLIAYFAWRHRLSIGKVCIFVAFTICALVFINMLPGKEGSDVVILSCLHMPLVLWSILGFAFVSNEWSNRQSRLEYLTYNGDLIVMSALIIIAGGLLTGITLGLFELIGLKIGQFYFNYVVVFGLSATPIVATYLVRESPQLVGRVSPVIARIFSPLVLIMLVTYLFAIVYTGKDPYNDREFLLIFNMLLVGVLAIIFFSVAESAKAVEKRVGVWVILLLCLVTMIVNGIALSAIVFRVSTFGVTPNRIAVLGSNVLIIINLLLVAVRILRILNGKSSVKEVGLVIASYLPIYGAWAAIVTFIFPWIFG